MTKARDRFRTDAKSHALHVRDRDPVAWCQQCEHGEPAATAMINEPTCRLMPTRNCPRQLAFGCEWAPCARLESDDEKVWEIDAAIFSQNRGTRTPPPCFSLSPADPERFSRGDHDG